jgi:ribosomal protein L11 methylase PrmA
VASRATRFSRFVVTVPRWIAEPYGTALVELGAGAVEQRDSEQTDRTELVVALPEDEATEPWQAAITTLSQAFAEELSLPSDAFTSRVDTLELDYHAAWLEHLTPQQLTDELWLVPTTETFAVPKGARRLLFLPHPSFGDGSHSTTRLASRATETFCRAHAGCKVLDVGTGNGVLSLVAAARGASSYGIDIDEAAISAAKQNARLNQLEQRCRFDTTPVGSICERFDLVLANLEPRVHFELYAALAERVSPLGQLLVTGFLVEQAGLIAEPLLDLGLYTTTTLEAEGYLLLGFERHEPSPRRACP